jgi:hypothetical protein
MTSFENSLTILRFSKCFNLCRYIKIVSRAKYEEFTSITNYLKEMTLWPKLMLILPSDTQVYACTTFIAFVGYSYMLMISTLSFHMVRQETSSNMVAILKIVMVL